MSRMTGARFMAETVHGYGLSHVFFMPFVAPRALMEMERLGIKRIQTHGEKAAAYMADAFARVRRKPSMVMAQSVGAMNLAAGLQDAYLACSPVIAVTGRERQLYQQRHVYQEVDHLAPFSAVTKYSAHVSEGIELPFVLRQAFRVATTATPGPVHIDLEGIAGQVVLDAERDFDVIVEDAFRQLPPFRPEADAETIAKAIRMLVAAERPVIVAGGGVVASDARDALIAVAERLSIPVATSLNAKAMFPFDHRLAVGIPGTYARDCANQVVGEADVVFFVGSRAGGQVSNFYSVPRQGTAIIQLDIDAAEIGRNYPTMVALSGDVRATLERMLEMATAKSAHDDWVARVQDLVRRWRRTADRLLKSDAIPMRPERLCHELTENLPSDAIVVADTGHAGIWTSTMLDLKHPEQSFIRCAGSLGWAVPAAIGAKCAAPDRPVVAFIGDGGFWYHLQELDTARKYGINAVIVVNNNHSLNQEKPLNEVVYGKRTAGSDELWLFPETDFAGIARSMGCLGLTVNKPGELAGALERAVSANLPAVIDVKTDVDAVAPRISAPA